MSKDQLNQKLKLMVEAPGIDLYSISEFSCFLNGRFFDFFLFLIVNFFSFAGLFDFRMTLERLKIEDLYIEEEMISF